MIDKPHFPLDPHALNLATQTLDRLLSAEADEQRAYLFRFPDGRISVQLEWIDIRSMISAAITTYVVHVKGAPGSCLEGLVVPQAGPTVGGFGGTSRCRARGAPRRLSRLPRQSRIS